MAAYVKTLLDKDNNQILPNTSVGAVSGLQSRLDSIDIGFGNKIDLTINSSTLKIDLINNSNIISTKTVNLPSVTGGTISGATYDTNTNELVLTFDTTPDATTVRIPAGDLTGALVRTVNSQNPDNSGNIAVSATNVPYSNSGTGLTGATVQAAVTELSAQKAAQTVLGTAWVAGTTYNVDDHVMHNGVMYKCKTANSDATWTASNWTVVDFAKETNDKIDSLSSAISLPGTSYSFAQGTATDTTATARLCCKLGYQKTGTKITVLNAKAGTFFGVSEYSDSIYTNKIHDTGWILSAPQSYEYTVIDNAYIAILITRDNYGAITPADITGYYQVTAKTKIGDVVLDLQADVDTLKTGATVNNLFSEWKQGVVTDPQNANRVSLFINNCEDGEIQVTQCVPGILYGVDIYDDEFYGNRISTTGWKTAVGSYPVENGNYVVITCARDNYSAINSSAVTNMTVQFVRDTKTAVEKNSENIIALEANEENNGIREMFAVPEYYIAQNYLDGKIAHFNTLAESCYGNGDALAFITDIHWKLNAKRSPALLNYIFHKTHIKTLFGGGDYSDAKHIDDTYFEVASILRDAWKKDVYFAIGNHEYLGNSGVYNTDNNLAYYYTAYYENNVVFGNKAREYFYVDNNASKIRYVVLNRYAESTNDGTSSNNGLESDQLNWFINTALNVDTGWGIVVVVHSIYGCNIVSENTIYPFVSEGSEGLVSAIEAYSGNGEIIAVISGHCHFDMVMRLTNGVPVIITTCDKNKSGGETPAYASYWTDRADGTVNEQAFDLFAIDRTARKITAIRIGCPAMTWTQSGNNYVRGASVEEREVTY